jgi:hypothetical protein
MSAASTYLEIVAAIAGVGSEHVDVQLRHELAVGLRQIDDGARERHRTTVPARRGTRASDRHKKMRTTTPTTDAQRSYFCSRYERAKSRNPFACWISVGLL